MVEIFGSYDDYINTVFNARKWFTVRMIGNYKTISLVDEYIDIAFTVGMMIYCMSSYGRDSWYLR
ncbi:hypothetical protein HMPREF0872_06310 [Veillonella montpellierensis DNF00314]|uniref:Uncharacterized protein n=1 Tax=Veillonella montpellierensis DNF00314 TaxID=1401067 RepID=A0A096AIM3_9FIRM|nr:hypothetical protein HMPREF0872_06310 [Veillonella montpellierensis DNF00314]